MELYTKTSYVLARRMTLDYSTSFGQSSKLFAKDIRNDVYAIYGLVRVADEIVDTYQGKNAGRLVKELEAHTMEALKNGFSPNPLVHAFVTTAKRYGISRDLIRPFFKSMHMDLKPKTFTNHLYSVYIYGSAEVIGLMCLKVFTDDRDEYKKLLPQARALGSAYQKVNFLRDMKSDLDERGRVYFPGVKFETFNEKQKAEIIKDIKVDFEKAKPAIKQLPKNARSAVAISYSFYYELLKKLDKTPVSEIKAGRIRVGALKKSMLLIKGKLTAGLI